MVSNVWGDGMRARTALLVSTVAPAAMLLVGCSALPALRPHGAAPSPTAGPPILLLPTSAAAPSSAPVSKTLTNAVSGCALAPTRPGVYVAPNGRTLALDSEAGGRPSGIDANDVRCIFEKLGMPAAEVKLLDSSLIWGGLQTASWSGLSARWTARSTSQLTASVYVVG